jgi:thioredoxin-dependent peroxiredoxin
MRQLAIGGLAPDFELPDQHGTLVRLSCYREKNPVVVYFYPRDDTSGCTAEACRFRDDFPRFQTSGVTVLGISSDSPESHARFAAKYKLPYTLLSDKAGHARKLFGVRKTFGLVPGRVTFVIDREGIVRHIFSSQSNPARHVEEALAAISRLTTSSGG